MAGFFATASLFTPSLQAADEATSTDQSAKRKMISLAEAEPVLYYSFRRYSKFYGDENTRHGTLFDRSQLLGNLGGVRDTLVNRGFFFDASVTQFLQGNVSGGKDDGSARYNGSTDYWLTFDSGKAGLWSAGAVFVHAESSWKANKSINPDVGSLLPANYDATMPTPGNTRLSNQPDQSKLCWQRPPMPTVQSSPPRQAGSIAGRDYHCGQACP
jgi:hypothetical protein